MVGRSQQDVSQRGAPRDSVVAHHEDFAIWFPGSPFIKPKNFAVKPSRAWLVVVFEGKPKPRELSDFFAVFISLQVDDVGNAQPLKLFHVRPCRNRAAKGQSFGHEEDFQLAYQLARMFRNQMICKRPKGKRMWTCYEALAAALALGFSKQALPAWQRRAMRLRGLPPGFCQ
jgi:hypothetical protein